MTAGTPLAQGYAVPRTEPGATRRKIVAWDCMCGRCGKQWTAFGPKLPKRCSRCKSPYWNRPRVYRLKKKRKAG